MVVVFFIKKGVFLRGMSTLSNLERGMHSIKLTKKTLVTFCVKFHL
ncbi:hypothetical protein KSS87_008316 [Heliosperma pusillum]|nr:hypothetical protein KSS87_008316 [Heliosperma pusillum]